MFVMRNGLFLVSERLGAHGNGTWSVPGGHLEFGETPQACAKRETFEETGLNIELNDIYEIGFTNDIFLEENKHYITLYYGVNYTGKEEAKNMEPDRQASWEWLTWDELCAKNLFIPMRNAIKKGLKP